MPHWSTALEHVPLRVDKIRPAAIRDAKCADHLLKAQNQRHKQRGGTHCGLLGDRHRSNLSGDRLRRADSGICAAGALEHGHLHAVDGDVQLQARGATVHSERRHPNSYTANHNPEDRPLRSKTYAANDTVELYCPWCATSLCHGNPTERIFSFSYHDFLVVWSKVIEATRLEDIVQPLVPYMAQRTVHRRRPGHPNTKGDKGPRPMEIGPQRASIRAASTPPQIVPPSASGLPSLCSEMRKRVAQGDFRLHAHQQ